MCMLLFMPDGPKLDEIARERALLGHPKLNVKATDNNSHIFMKVK